MSDLYRFYNMEVDGLSPSESRLVGDGITWPALVAVNSHLLGDTRSSIRLELLNSLEQDTDDKGFMPFFRNPELQKKYPPDLESTAMYVSARHVAGLTIETDLDMVESSIGDDGLFNTWTKRTDRPVDHISQLIMCLCYGQVGIDIGRTLEAVTEQKLKDLDALSARDKYYKSPLLFIYFSLFVPDKGAFPQHYKSLIQDFLEQYEPQNKIEVEIIAKTCRVLGIATPRQLNAIEEDRVIFTNGNRSHIGFSSLEFDEILGFSSRRGGIDLLLAA